MTMHYRDEIARLEVALEDSRKDREALAEAMLELLRAVRAALPVLEEAARIVGPRRKIEPPRLEIIEDE